MLSQEDLERLEGSVVDQRCLRCQEGTYVEEGDFVMCGWLGEEVTEPPRRCIELMCDGSGRGVTYEYSYDDEYGAPHSERWAADEWDDDDEDWDELTEAEVYDRLCYG